MHVVRTDRAPAPFQGAPYSQGIVFGDLVFVSGQVGSREDGSPEPDFAKQVQLAFDNLEAVLKAAGASFDDVVDVLAEVKASGLACYALSNMEPDRFALRRSRYPFFGLFDGCVISGVEGVAKPDRAIFEILFGTKRDLPADWRQ